MTLRTASVSKGVSDAVGSSKMTTRCGTFKARAICTSWRWAMDRREMTVVGSMSAPRAMHRFGRLPVHRTVVEDDAAPYLAAHEDVLGDRQMRREENLLVNQDDAAALCVDRAGEDHRAAVEQDVTLARRQMAGEDLHQGGFAGAVLANDGVHLAGAKPERDVTEHLDRAERFRQMLRLEQVRCSGAC